MRYVYRAKNVQIIANILCRFSEIKNQDPNQNEINLKGTLTVYLSINQSLNNFSINLIL